MSSASKYQVNITMSQATVDTLNQESNQLYGFKAVSGPGGTPTVWFATGEYGTNTHVKWTETYRVFTSQTVDIGPNTQVTMDNDYPATLTDVLNVDSPAGTGTVVGGGSADSISVNNLTSTPFSCGLSLLQADGVTYGPLAVFPIHGHALDEMVPVEKVFLMFASSTVDTGTVIEKSFSQGILIDLTDAPVDASGAVSRTVAFDVDAGWSNDQALWGTVLDPKSDLVPLLIGGQVPAGV